jgi:hypothetical protein
MIKKIWTDPVWSKVIAVGIVAIIAPWVAADIAGAVVGAAGGAIGSYTLNR